MRRLSKTISMETLAGAGLNYAKNVAEEALTRGLVAVDKNIDGIKSTAKWGGAYLGLCVLDEHVNNVIVDGIIDVAQGVTGGVTIVKGVKTANAIVKDYGKVTDEDVNAVEEKLKSLIGTTTEETQAE